MWEYLSEGMDQFSSLYSPSCVRLFATPRIAALRVSPYFTISWNLLKLMSMELVMPSNHLIVCHLLLLLPSIFPRIRVFFNELVLRIRWPKHWSFSNIQDWFPLGLTGWISLQSKGLSRVIPNTTVQKHQFFSTQLSLYSHLYMTPSKTIALTRLTFVDKVMSLLFNMLSRLVIKFLPRSKHLLIS